MPEELAALTENQQRLLESVRLKSQRRAAQAINKAELTRTQQEALNSAKQRLLEAPLVHHIRLQHRYQRRMVITNILDVGRLMNAVEIGDFPGGIRDQHFRNRLLNEFKIYGATREVQIISSHMPDSDRPIYTAVDYIGGYRSVAPLYYFSPYRFVLRPELKKRATFTPADSFMAESDQVYIWDYIEGVLVTKLNGRFWYEYILEEQEPFSTREGIYYIEAQVLGGVSLSDVIRLYYPAGDRTNRSLFQRLRRLELDYGIEIVYY